MGFRMGKLKIFDVFLADHGGCALVSEQDALGSIRIWLIIFLI